VNWIARLIVNPTTEERATPPAGGDTAAAERQRRERSYGRAGSERVSFRGARTESIDSVGRCALSGSSHMRRVLGPGRARTLHLESFFLFLLFMSILQRVATDFRSRRRLADKMILVYFPPPNRPI
jgi:hypothetical protein